MSATKIVFDFEGMLRRLTRLDRWREVEPAPAGVGVSWRFEADAGEREVAVADVRLDQSDLRIDVVGPGRGATWSLELDVENLEGTAYADFVARADPAPGLGR